MGLVKKDEHWCSRCKNKYTPRSPVDGDLKHVAMKYTLTWVKNYGEENQIDKSRRGKPIFCAACTDSLMAWFTDGGVTD